MRTRKLRVEVVAALPRGARTARLELPEGAVVVDALAASGLDGEYVGIFGRRVARDTRLSDGDRVEIYRPLPLDPKEARRRRAASRYTARTKRNTEKT